uniref:CCHC-type domain-containing protein n=2 Tax=Xenopus tropicalis TaxID=8364 RepID=A0A803JZ06_XENTR
MGKKTKPFGRVVETRLRSSRKATESNIMVTVERTAEGNVSCSDKGKEKKSKSCSQSGMESDSEDLGAGVGVTAGSCGATAEADQEVRGESDGCKMAAGSEGHGSHMAMVVAESVLTNQEMAAANGEHGSCVALEVAESALSDQEMATACEVHGSRVALESEQVMAAGPLGKAGEVHKGTETVIQYDTIINALKELRCLEEKQSKLNRDIDRLIKSEDSLKGERRTLFIREVTFLNKELEETEIYIKDILAVIEPWRALYGNKQRFEQMKEGNVTTERLLKVAELLKETEVSKTVAECSVATDTVHSNGLSNTDGVCAAAVSGMRAEVQVIAGNATCVTEGGGEGKNVVYSAGESNVHGGTESVAGAAGGSVWEGRRFFAREQDDEFDDEFDKRKNVVKIKWEKEREDFPGRRFVGRNIIKQLLGFTPQDVYALLSVTDTEFDLSYNLSQGLEEFWRRYHLSKEAKEWEGFRVIPVSKPETKLVTIIMKRETVHEQDILIWLRRQCTVLSPLEPVFDEEGFWVGGYKVLSPLEPVFDEEGFWVGGYKVQVKLHVDQNVQKHLPNSFFIGKARGVCFYVGQPRLCYKCGSNRHYAVKCNIQKCALCGETGHPSKECVKAIKCNLCMQSGHAYRACPDAWRNIRKACPNLEKVMSTPMPGENLPQTEGRGEERAGGAKETDRGRPTEVRGKERENKQAVVQASQEEGGGGDGWIVVGSKYNKAKEAQCPGVITLPTENRFVLPGGKSWGDLAEEQVELERMEEEEEEREKRKSLSSDIISSRKKSKREGAFQSQGAEKESLEEGELGEQDVMESQGAGVRVQVKRSAGKCLDNFQKKKHKDAS